MLLSISIKSKSLFRHCDRVKSCTKSNSVAPGDPPQSSVGLKFYSSHKSSSFSVSRAVPFGSFSSKIDVFSQVAVASSRLPNLFRRRSSGKP